MVLAASLRRLNGKTRSAARRPALGKGKPGGVFCWWPLGGADAEHERARCGCSSGRDRGRVARARAAGKQLGRPRVATQEAIRRALAEPGRRGLRMIAKRFGVSLATMRRIRASLPPADCGSLQIL